jgi:hypothetical protein
VSSHEGCGLVQTAEKIAKALRAQFDLEASEGGKVTSWGQLWDFLNGRTSLEIDGVPEAIVLQEVVLGYGDDPSLLVFRVGDRYFAHSGWYVSHYGYEWEDDDNLTEVVPSQRIVKFWKDVR